eukprot:gb/GECG01014084.1/.p1 GENE.gb/GECG01014084.1/~~gb/GECG01014084.1/.p1  ORF type:complete len:120 (+),score=10.92 gb/GECG01014084.1/:1-360(+)
MALSASTIAQRYNGLTHHEYTMVQRYLAGTEEQLPTAVVFKGFSMREQAALRAISASLWTDGGRLYKLERGRSRELLPVEKWTEVVSLAMELRNLARMSLQELVLPQLLDRGPQGGKVR